MQLEAEPHLRLIISVSKTPFFKSIQMNGPLQFEPCQTASVADAVAQSKLTFLSLNLGFPEFFVFANTLRTGAKAESENSTIGTGRSFSMR